MSPRVIAFLITVWIMATACNKKEQSANAASLDFVSKIAQSPDEETVILDLIKRFDKMICAPSVDRPIHECYELHAISMRDDFIQKRPFTLSFPYDGSFDLSILKKADVLSFLTKICGIEDETNQKTIHYYCLKSESTYTNFYSDIKPQSQFITDFLQEYQSKKSITPSIRQQTLLSSLEQLDFSIPEHRFFYMILHIVINEEHLAYSKL